LLILIHLETSPCPNPLLIRHCVIIIVVYLPYDFKSSIPPMLKFFNYHKFLFYFPFIHQGRLLSRTSVDVLFVKRHLPAPLFTVSRKKFQIVQAVGKVYGLAIAL